MHHQTPVTCTHGIQSFHTLKNCLQTVGGNTIFKYTNFFVATVWKWFFSSKGGCPQYSCPYNECTSHWCLVMNFWLKVCILKSHQRCSAGYWEITIKPFIRRGWPNTFVHIVCIYCIYIYIFFLGPLFCHPVHAAVAYNYSDRCWEIYRLCVKPVQSSLTQYWLLRQFVWMLKVTCLLLYSFSLLRNCSYMYSYA